ncbi:MAG: type III-A CRISPR-associated protein Csm2 [Candidatus Helarchaeota archaeon]
MSRYQQQERRKEFLNIIRNLKSLAELKEEWIYDQDGYVSKMAKRVRDENYKATQIRKFFDEFKSIQLEVKNYKDEYSEIKTKLLKIKPSLAYAAGRKSATGRNLLPRWFTEICFVMIDKVTDDEKSFQNFIDIFESLIAYFKYYGGKD